MRAIITLTQQKRELYRTGERDVEVTAKMIEAGEARLFQFDPDYSDSEKTVREIFLAMMAARHQAD